MYIELLNIIYTYVFNYKEPDKPFLENVLDIVINNDNLREFIKDINYNCDCNYDYNAAYVVTSKILKFNITNILEDAKRVFSLRKRAYELGTNISDLEKYIYLSLTFILTVLHELEHVRQIKTLETTHENTFEKILIQNSLDILSINPDFYEKKYNLFPIERMANINSTGKLIEMLRLDNDFSSFANKNFNNEYEWAITQYYIYGRIPLLEYINITRSSLYYEDILINKENSKKLLRRVKKEVSLDNRILFGLPITKKELTKINSK